MTFGETKPMLDEAKRRDLARGEAKVRIHWGADVEDVAGFLRADHGYQFTLDFENNTVLRRIKVYIYSLDADQLESELRLLIGTRPGDFYRSR